jgi:hypothetical protein
MPDLVDPETETVSVPGGVITNQLDRRLQVVTTSLDLGAGTVRFDVCISRVGGARGVGWGLCWIRFTPPSIIRHDVGGSVAT